MREICAPNRAHRSGTMDSVRISALLSTPQLQKQVLLFFNTTRILVSILDFFSGSCLMGLLVIFSIGSATHYQPNLMKQMHIGLCGSL